MNKKQLVYNREPIYFLLVVLSTALVYASAFFFIDTLLILALLLLVSWGIHMHVMVGIRKNAVKISAQQFPMFYEKAQALANSMQLKKTPQIYVMESGGLLNAFASKFGTKNMVVINSDVFALIREGAEDEVTYILAHEFAHLKRNHVNYSWLLMPGLLIPLLSSAYSRACEFTCDAYGAYYANNPVAAQNALTLLAIGPKLYKDVNQQEFVNQMDENKDFFAWFEEITSTHPNLPRRIDYIRGMFDTNYSQKDPHSISHVIGGVIGALALFAAIIFGVLSVSINIDKWTLQQDREEILSYYADTGINDLMEAVILNDVTEIESHLTNNVDLAEVSDEGYTALHIAVMQENLEVAKRLIKAGSPLNSVDNFGNTPLYEAIYYENIDMIILLLDNGAHITKPVVDALDYVYDEEIIELVESYQ